MLFRLFGEATLGLTYLLSSYAVQRAPKVLLDGFELASGWNGLDSQNTHLCSDEFLIALSEER